jgi:thioredoxin-dependent peroxiredoxin
MKRRILALVLLTIGIVGIGQIQSVFAETAFAVREGEPAPDFTLPDQEGKPVTLSSLRGKWVVLYFYPKDDTPGCTKEACSFRDNIVAIQQLNATVLGVSVDSVASHKKFSDKHKLNFQILADDQFNVSKQYGTLTRFMGMRIAGRSTAIIDPKGTIRKLFPSVEPTDHAREIHQALKSLQTE